MRNVKAKIGAAAVVALAVVASAPATSHAEPTGPNVKYVLTSDTGVTMEVSYLAAQPPSMEAYNADPYAFLKKEEVRHPLGVQHHARGSAVGLPADGPCRSRRAGQPPSAL